MRQAVAILLLKTCILFNSRGRRFVTHGERNSKVCWWAEMQGSREEVLHEDFLRALKLVRPSINRSHVTEFPPGTSSFRITRKWTHGSLFLKSPSYWGLTWVSCGSSAGHAAFLWQHFRKDKVLRKSSFTWAFLQCPGMWSVAWKKSRRGFARQSCGPSNMERHFRDWDSKLRKGSLFMVRQVAILLSSQDVWDTLSFQKHTKLRRHALMKNGRNVGEESVQCYIKAEDVNSSLGKI